MNKKISICCATYNHKKFIKNAIDGFLIQKTEYAMEIIIHDDASTDGTTDIIREYQKQYPDMIKAIIQTKNQYSQGIDVWREYIFPQIEGDYVALCEGDDYWTDPSKLQKQVSYMENHPDCSGTFHAVWYENDGEKVWLDRKFDEETDAPVEKVLESGMYCSTLSLCYRKEVNDEWPSFRAESKACGDYPLQLLIAIRGRFHFFPEVMGVYRWIHAGSYMEKIKNNKEKEIAGVLDNAHFLRLFDEETKYKYTAIVSSKILYCLGMAGLYGGTVDKREAARCLEEILNDWKKRDFVIINIDLDIEATCCLSRLIEHYAEKEGKPLALLIRREYQIILLNDHVNSLKNSGCVAEAASIGGIPRDVVEEVCQKSGALTLHCQNQRRSFARKYLISKLGLHSDIKDNDYRLKYDFPIEREEQAETILNRNGFKAGRTVIVSPNEDMKERKTQEFWRQIVRNIKDRGYDVLFNYEGNEIEDWPSIYLRLDVTLLVVERAGYLVGKRQGLLDAASAFTNAEVIELTEQNEENVEMDEGKHYHFVSFVLFDEMIRSVLV